MEEQKSKYHLNDFKIILKYLKNKKSCPFVKLTDDEVRLVRIWSVVWNSLS